MKKWLLRIIVAFGLIVFFITGLIAWNEMDYQRLTSRTRNDELKTLKHDWQGNALDQKDRFMDERNQFLPSTVDLLRWKFSDGAEQKAKQADPWRLEVKDPSAFLASDEDGILWLGHASFYIRLNGVGILTDPLFGHTRLIDRFTPVPSPLGQIRKVDYVLLSHDHRDHMDEDTLRAVAEKFPQATFLAGLRSEDVLNEWKTSTNKIGTAGWFQEFNTADDRVKVYFHPVRHWSRRWLFDTNWRLWGSFVIESGATKIYFGGDSGYADHYREIGELHAGIDYFLIGIGAYEPRWFMKPNHNSPADAVKAFQDIGALNLVPMHYATFDLGDESPSQPLRLLLEEAEKSGIRKRVKPLAIYEHLSMEDYEQDR